MIFIQISSHTSNQGLKIQLMHLKILYLIFYSLGDQTFSHKHTIPRGKFFVNNRTYIIVVHFLDLTSSIEE